MYLQMDASSSIKPYNTQSKRSFRRKLSDVPLDDLFVSNEHFF